MAIILKSSKVSPAGSRVSAVTVLRSASAKDLMSIKFMTEAESADGGGHVFPHGCTFSRTS